MIRDVVIDIHKVANLGEGQASGHSKKSEGTLANSDMPSIVRRKESLDQMEASMETYKLHHMDLRIEDLLSFPIQVGEVVRKSAEEADSFKQECGGLSKEVERLVQLLRQAARFSTANAAGLYERPTRRIMLEVLKALERALHLVKKCKRSGILKRVMTITTTTDFRKVNLWLENSIGDVSWLLNISSSGDERSEYAGLPPIASTDPVLALVWEQVSIVHVGMPEERTGGAEYLGTLAKGNERNVKIIIEEGGVSPLLRLLKDGTVAGQEAAAIALGQLARDKQRVQELRVEGASNAFTHILASHSASMKVQLQVAMVVAKFASLDEEVQVELASQGAIRLLVALLAHDTIVDDITPNKLANKPNSIHNIVSSNMPQLRSTATMALRSQSPGASDYLTSDDPFGSFSTPKMKPVLALTQLKNSGRAQVSPENSFPGSRMTSSHRQSSLKEKRSHREREDPETKAELKVQAAHALWKLAAGNVKNCKLITDTCALLCFAKLIETGKGEVRYNSIMAVMEIAAAAERDSELRRAAFKTNSPSAKAVVQRLLAVVRDEDEEPDLQIPCAKAIGSLARIFPAPAKPQIAALTLGLSSLDFRVATEAATALSKFASDENYLHLEHSKNILEEGAAEHLVQLVVNFGYSDSQLAALELLCYLSLNVADSEALARAATLPALETILRSQLLVKHENARPLVSDAIAKLELYQMGSFGSLRRSEPRSME